jgi:hypothetical protein
MINREEGMKKQEERCKVYNRDFHTTIEGWK